MSAYETGALLSTAHPAAQRAFYEQKLLENLRTKSIMVPFTVMKEDFSARDTGRITYSEVFDTEPSWNALSESDIWLKGAHLDSRSLTIDLEIHGDVIKVSEYNELVNFWNSGDLRGLVDGKLGQNMVDTLDILARNAFLSNPYKTYVGGNSARSGLDHTDLFTVDMAETIRTHLEERDVPGIQAVTDADMQTMVCITTPRVIHDLRTATNSSWVDANQYAGAAKIFSGEVGMWNGVRFIRTNRLVLPNAASGDVTIQNSLNGATIPGQGAYATVDGVYTPGQSGSTRYITLTSVTTFAVGQKITIHDNALGTAVLETDGTQETRRIVNIDVGNNRISLDKPLLKAHGTGDYVTTGIDVQASIFVGGPGVVYAVGERPHVLNLPTIDDMAMIRRFGWRGFLKFQLFRPEFFEVVESTGSTA